MIEQTEILKADTALAGLVMNSNQLLENELQQYSRAAKAKWDLQRDEKGRPLLLLTLRDPFGFASDRFAPDELQNPRHLGGRLHRLLGDLPQTSRPVRVPIRETPLF